MVARFPECRVKVSHALALRLNSETRLTFLGRPFRSAAPARAGNADAVTFHLSAEEIAVHLQQLGGRRLVTKGVLQRQPDMLTFDFRH